MENLNAEAVKKALECCTRSGCSDNETKDCPLKPYEDCTTRLATNALALINSQEQRIKELTEDNEYLKTQVTATEARYESRKESDLEEVLELRLKVEELTEENERLRAEKEVLETDVKDLKGRNNGLQRANESLAKDCDILEDELNECVQIEADTVREMQERFLELLEKEHRIYTPEGADFMFKNGSIMMWSVAERVFRQIAKEMVEGKNDNT